MKTEELIKNLNKNKGKELLFEFSKDKYAGTNYHLTEVKNVQFNSVDCGGNPNNWKETHLQLWESPSEIGKKDYITVDKVVSILEKVNKINPLWLETEVKVEYGNEEFHTSIMNIAGFSLFEDKIIVQLFSEKTLCKAPDSCRDTKEETCCNTTSSCC